MKSSKELLEKFEEYQTFRPTRIKMTRHSQQYVDEYICVWDRKDGETYMFVTKYAPNYFADYHSDTAFWAKEANRSEQFINKLFKELGNEDKWDRRFLDLAKHVSGYSKDPSTKVGAVVVDDDGNVRTVAYNGFPRGVRDSDERLNNRELKYQYVVHSELNAISHCARIGVPTKGATLVCTHFPCSVCAGAIVQAGFKEVIVFASNDDFASRWSGKNEIATTIFMEGNVDVVVMPEKETS